jgi:probable HAF family extracellular repeat protein
MNVHLLMNERSFTVKGKNGKPRNTNPNHRKRDKEMKKLSVFLVALMASLAIGISTARGQLGYSLTDLGVVEDMDNSIAAALNNQGHVAGTAYKGQESCAFHYDYLKNIMEDAGGTNSRGFGINSFNAVAGDAFFASPGGPKVAISPSHATVFQNGVVQDLGVLAGQVYSRANGINAMGQVVGYSGPQRDSAQSRAFVWSSQTGMFDIGTLGGPYAQAYAINDSGFITGTARTGADPTGTTQTGPATHAFIYNPKGAGPAAMRDLGVLGGNSSYGMAINNYNHVAGYSTIKTTSTTNDGRVHAFLHNGTKMIDLGSLGGYGSQWGSDASVALGLNNVDQVVGYSYLPATGGMPIQQVAFLWRSGQMINLNTLLFGDGKNYLVFSAAAIDDYGQIAASAYDMRTGNARAVLLTPAGPPPPP